VRAVETANVAGSVKLRGNLEVRNRRPQAGQGNPVEPDWRAGTFRWGITSSQDGHLLSYRAILLAVTHLLANVRSELWSRFAHILQLLVNAVTVQLKSAQIPLSGYD
jgi:hypothetical protein